MGDHEGEATNQSKQDDTNNVKLSFSRIRSQRSPSPASAHVPKRIKTTVVTSNSSSMVGSPKTSRDPSPNRAPSKQSSTTRLSRSRKNSQELNRINVSTIPDTPSPAAIQRALAAAGTSRQASPLTSEFPTTDTTNKSQKSSRTPSVTRSIRLTSPPPNNVKRDLEAPSTPSIIVNQATPKSATSFENIEEEVEDQMLNPGIRSPAKVNPPLRLEAVQESTDPETPAISSANKQFIPKFPTRTTTIAETLDDKGSTVSPESGSESTGGKSVNSNATTDPKPPKSVQPRRSNSQMSSSTKAKTTGDGTLRNMTVETETVSSVPLMTMGTTDSRGTSGKQDPNATLRMKPSTETIRPKKEKKKTVRKAPSIASTTGTSKADIFEAKVKSAVEEADSSDSEETFVYESNPADTAPRRHHSRTPSMNSVASQGDYYRGRYRQATSTSLVGKKSMKFANTAKNMPNSPSAEDPSSAGTPTGTRPTPTDGSGQFPRHIGRHGRHPAHLSLFDSDAPFNSTRSPKKATAGSFSRKASPRPHTPRSNGNLRTPATGKSYGGNYDLEADDERTPLVSSTIRSTRSRRRVFHPDDDEYYYYPERRSTVKWIGACACFGSLFSLLVALVVIALILCSRPLQSVHLKEIDNVLASDKQIIFDLRVQAVNPNLVGLTITDMNLFVHARSSYVGDSKWWRKHDGLEQQDIANRDHVDEGNDPILDDPHLMLLGQVSSFDAPLAFDPSPWHHDVSSSTGEVRLDRPGNSTEVDKDRWETVLHHDFDLIVRGVLKYTLPISSRVRSAEISGKTLVKPNILPGPSTPETDEPKKGNSTKPDETRISTNPRLDKYQHNPIRLGTAFNA